MLIWIICSGDTGFTYEKDYDAQGYLSACREEEDAPILPESKGRSMKRNGRSILLAPGNRSRETARLFFGEEEFQTESLLSPVVPDLTEKGRHSPKGWHRKLLGKQREAADALIQRLEQKGENCVLIASAQVVEVLLDRLRLRGYCQARTGVFGLKPLEHIQVSHRDDHCGFCNHNCLLSNPGCPIGRDKAMRKGIQYREE